MRDKMKASAGGGEREDSCDHSLSRRSLRVNPSRVEMESK